MDKIRLAGCVILNDDKILLLHRKKTAWYELPGGKIDESEAPEEAAKRELKEELLVDVEIINKIGTKDFEQDGHIMEYNWFLAKIKEGQNPKVGEPDKYGHLNYIPLSELSQHKLSPNMQNLVSELNLGNISLK